MTFIKEILFVGIGGFLGSAARYGVYLAVARCTGSSFPFGTLAVNIIGSFIIGLVVVLLQDAHYLWRLFLMVGIIGGFTTFSAFSHETLVLFNNNQVFYALLNIALNVIICLACVFAGFKLGKMFLA